MRCRSRPDRAGTRSAGSPARTGTIESSNHVASPTAPRLLERPQAVREDRDARRHRAHVHEERLRVEVERPSVVRRVVAQLEQLAWRLPVTMNSDPAPATIRNHGEISTPTATPPAIARSTNPAATAPRSSTASCLSHTLYASGEADVSERRRSASCGRANERQPDRDGCSNDTGDDRAARPRSSPDATGRRCFVGCVAVGVDVERVVQVVGAARRPGRSRRTRSRCRRPLAFGEHTRRAGCGDHEHVLQPLLRTCEPQPRRGLAAACARLGTGGC